MKQQPIPIDKLSPIQATEKKLH